MNSTTYKTKIKNKEHMVYKWTLGTTKEYYIGKHSGTEDDGYIGSGSLFKERWHTTEPTKWHRVILGFYPSSDAAYYAESIAVADHWCNDPLCLNLMPGGKGNYESRLKRAEYKKRVASKYCRSSKYSIAQWISSILIYNFIFVGQNSAGKSKFFTEIPNHLKHLYSVAKDNSNLTFPVEVMDATTELSDDERSWVPTPDCVEQIKTLGCVEDYREFSKEFSRIGELYNERNTKK